jgi:hypothetical protein
MVMFKIQRVIDRSQAAIDLSCSSLYHVPDDLRTLPDLGQLTDVNLASNRLFNGEGHSKHDDTRPALFTAWPAAPPLVSSRQATSCSMC